MSTPINHPTRPGFVDIRWQGQSVVAEQENPFTLHASVYAWSGQRRLVTVRLPPMDREDAGEWIAWVCALNGIEGTFYLRDSVGKNLLGRAVGFGLVDGASQTGSTLNTKGWQANTIQLFAAGDWISVDDRLYTVLADVNSNASGLAALTIWPKIRTAYANNHRIEIGANARGIFRLNEYPEYGYGVDRLMDGFSFGAKEVIP